MIPEFLLNTDPSFRITFYDNDDIEVEKFDDNNSFESRVVLSVESFREIQSNLDKWLKERERKLSEQNKHMGEI